MHWSAWAPPAPGSKKSNLFETLVAPGGKERWVLRVRYADGARAEWAAFALARHGAGAL